jgi:peptidoglycan/xylan/chitin deacetylase (PgdA/CDA1 family)
MGPGGGRSMIFRVSSIVAVTAVAVSGCSGGGGESPARGAPTRAPVDGSPAGDRWARWGLRPMRPAPAPPNIKPVRLTATGPIPVIYRIPTKRKIVFVTIDDGKEKDPRFVRLLADLKIPISMFLMDDAIKDDYAYFKPLQAMGNHIQNHSLHHPVMSRLPLARQRQEVCGAQEVLTRRYGVAPLLFRPPYGDWNTNTKTAVAGCGPRAIVLWRESMEINDMQYLTADKKVQPGDIILAHFRGPAELKGKTMTAMFIALLKRIEQQGFAVARLEDYIQPPRQGALTR